MARKPHPVRRCVKCDENWPSTSTYNLCPICQRNTIADTDDSPPDETRALVLLNKHAKIRDFDRQCDEGTLRFVDEEWVAEMEALLELTPNIPDPPETRYWNEVPDA